MVNPKEADAQMLGELEKLATDYPYFQTAQTLRIVQSINDNTKTDNGMLLFASDAKKLYYILSNKAIAEPWANTYTEYSQNSKSGYLQLIAKQAKEMQSKQKKVENTKEEEIVSETLALIYRKQGFYDKAIEAFRKLSLKYPEKNSYFAALISETEIQKDNSQSIN